MVNGVRTIRIEAGILDNITDFDTHINPFQAGLGAFIDLAKPGYIGREALLEAVRRVLLLGLKTAAGTPAYRADVLDGAAAVWSPTLECGIAYVKFHAAADWIGCRLSVPIDDGGTADCEIVPLPFYDKEKKIPRGLAAE